jgi:hypothetical protein
MNISHSQGLARFYAFFNSHGTERLNGLDESYFYGLSDQDRAEAWNFLEKDFEFSVDSVTGLYLIDKNRAVDLFKNKIQQPIDPTLYAEDRRELECNYLLMLRYIFIVDHNETYIQMMNPFAGSEFKNVRAKFTQFLPTTGAPATSIEALKGMIFTETETIPLSSAIMKFMEIHGLFFNRKDPIYKSLYASLSSEDQQEKQLAMHALEKTSC